MHFSNIVLALAGFSSLAAAAPTVQGRFAVDPVRHVDKRDTVVVGGNAGSTIIIEQTIVQPVVTVIQENLGLVSELALLAEQEFSALVQARLALVQEIETIKNNIRINTFLARFAQVNTVIVVVTPVVDLRNAAAPNNRYMVNQLLADTGNTQSSVVVMMTASSTMTINAPTATGDLTGALAGNGSVTASIVSATAAATAASAAASVAAAPSSAAVLNSTTGAAALAANNSAAAGAIASGQIAAYDANSPFGQISQCVILPYGSQAPTLSNGAQIVVDPAAIILPNQGSLLVENINQFAQDCAVLASTAATLFNLQSAILQADQIAAALASGLTIGSSASLNSAAAALLGVGASVPASSSVATDAPAATSTAGAGFITITNTPTDAAATSSPVTDVSTATVSEITDSATATVSSTADLAAAATSSSAAVATTV